MTSHGDSGLQHEQPRLRRRPALSCIECRRRKIKCNRNHPCAHCISSSTHCIYREAKRSVHSPQSNGQGSYPTPANASSTHATETEIRHSDTGYSNENSGRTAGESLNASAYAINDGRLIEILGRRLDDISSRLEKLEDTGPGPIVSSPHTSQDLVLHHPGVQDLQTILNKTRITRWSNWIAKTPEVCETPKLYHGPH